MYVSQTGPLSSSIEMHHVNLQSRVCLVGQPLSPPDSIPAVARDRALMVNTTRDPLPMDAPPRPRQARRRA